MGTTDDIEVTKIPMVPRWAGPAFAVLAIGTVPWIVFLAVTLPRHATVVHYRGVWVGFDLALVFVLATTAVLAWRGRPRVTMAATATATMLFVDAWFDVLTTPRSGGRWLSLLLAAGVELPLAATCLWIALHASRTIEAQAAVLVRELAPRSGEAARTDSLQ